LLLHGPPPGIEDVLPKIEAVAPAASTSDDIYTIAADASDKDAAMVCVDNGIDVSTSTDVSANTVSDASTNNISDSCIYDGTSMNAITNSRFDDNDAAAAFSECCPKSDPDRELLMVITLFQKQVEVLRKYNSVIKKNVHDSYTATCQAVVAPPASCNEVALRIIRSALALSRRTVLWMALTIWRLECEEAEVDRRFMKKLDENEARNFMPNAPNHGVAADSHCGNGQLLFPDVHQPNNECKQQ